MVNKFDKSGKCAQEGDRAEDLFVKIAEWKGLICKKSSKADNIASHIDIILDKQASDKTWSVDVKAMKKTSRSASSAQDQYVWIEFKNVQGNKGWLYGKADIIAFELENTFALVNRERLADWCEKNVDMTKTVKSPAEAIKKVYTRKGRKDQISLIPIKEIGEFIQSSWDK